MARVQGVVICRRWDADEGLQEIEFSFQALDELMRLCLSVSDPMTIDRIVLTGEDAHGEARSITFAFQAATAGDGL